LFLEMDMEQKKKTILARAAPFLEWLITYIDDLLMLGSGICFVAAAAEQFGRPAAMATAGACLAVYAVVIARAKRGGRSK
jgi:hypothetical protein